MSLIITTQFYNTFLLLRRFCLIVLPIQAIKDQISERPLIDIKNMFTLKGHHNLLSNDSGLYLVHSHLHCTVVVISKLMVTSPHLYFTVVTTPNAVSHVDFILILSMGDQFVCSQLGTFWRGLSPIPLHPKYQTAKRNYIQASFTYQTYN